LFRRFHSSVPKPARYTIAFLEEVALLAPFLPLGRECAVAPTFGLLGALKFPRMAVGAAFGATAAAADQPPELPGVCATPRVAVWVTTGARHAWILSYLKRTVRS
jgi:hypothetical protein